MILLLLALANSFEKSEIAPEKRPEYAPVVTSWITTKGYPKEALRHGWEGIAGFTVTVGTDGKVQDCKIIETSGYPVLDEATCREIIAHARFKPALDHDGKPIISTYSQRVRWQISK